MMPCTVRVLGCARIQQPRCPACRGNTASRSWRAGPFPLFACLAPCGRLSRVRLVPGQESTTGASDAPRALGLCAGSHSPPPLCPADNTYTVSGARDHFRDQLRSGAVQIEAVKDYGNFFSVLPHHPDATARCCVCTSRPASLTSTNVSLQSHRASLCCNSPVAGSRPAREYRNSSTASTMSRRSHVRSVISAAQHRWSQVSTYRRVFRLVAV